MAQWRLQTCRFGGEGGRGRSPRPWDKGGGEVRSPKKFFCGPSGLSSPQFALKIRGPEPLPCIRHCRLTFSVDSNSPFDSCIPFDLAHQQTTSNCVTTEKCPKEPFCLDNLRNYPLPPPPDYAVQEADPEWVHSSNYLASNVLFQCRNWGFFLKSHNAPFTTSDSRR